MKYLVLVFALFLALWWWRRSRPTTKTPPAPPPPREKVESMYRCSVCGVHVPEPEAVFDSRGKAYCGTPHLRQGASSSE